MRELLAAGFAVATERRVRFAVQLLLAAGLVFVLLRIRSIWRTSHVDLAHVQWGWLGGAISLALCAAAGSAFIWLAILRRLGVATRPAWAGIFLQAQLGKYVPGALWQYAGRSALAQTQGVPLRVVARTLPIELIASAYAGAAFSILLVGWWGVVGVIAAISAAQLLAARVPSRWVVVRTSAEMTVPYAAVTWPLIVASFWMTARAFIDVPVGDLAVYAGAFAAAWIVGLIAIYAPGGLGVREAILVALLHGRIGSADALVIALASRGVFTLADLVAAGAGVLTLRRPSGNVVEPAG
jgi:glycosyltransferase 2 family protein